MKASKTSSNKMQWDFAEKPKGAPDFICLPESFPPRIPAGILRRRRILWGLAVIPISSRFWPRFERRQGFPACPRLCIAQFPQIFMEKRMGLVRSPHFLRAGHCQETGKRLVAASPTFQCPPISDDTPCLLARLAFGKAVAGAAALIFFGRCAWQTRRPRPF